MRVSGHTGDVIGAFTAKIKGKMLNQSRCTDAIHFNQGHIVTKLPQLSDIAVYFAFYKSSARVFFSYFQWGCFNTNNKFLVHANQFDISGYFFLCFK